MRCLAFASNIQDDIWAQFAAEKETHVLLLLHTAEHLVHKTESIFHAKVIPVHRQSYLGYDKRDVKDYHVEGYAEEEEELRRQLEEKADREDRIMTNLLLLTQLFAHPIEMLEVMVENARDGHAEVGLASSILQMVVKIAHSLLSFTSALFEDGGQQALRALVVLSAQLPPLRHPAAMAPAPRTEISDLFVTQTERQTEAGALQQSLLYLLNENAYPNLDYTEARAVLRFILAALYTPTGQGQGAQSCFFLNDVKVLVEITLRELTNILRNSGDARLDSLRGRYVNIIPY